MVSPARRLGSRTRLAVVLALAGVFVAWAATPAIAHTRAAAASPWDSRITGAPDVAEVAWRTYAGGDLLQVTVSGDVTVEVAGYDGEPYLRVTAAGVEVNDNSPAAYLNADRYADVALPPRADPTSAPAWRQVSTRPGYAWHDHRIHWMAPTPPPAVTDDPDAAQLVQLWSVALTVDGHPHELTGELWWQPGPSALPWLAVALLVTAPAGVGAWRARRGPVEPRRKGLQHVRAVVRPAALVVAVVATVNTIHFVDELTAWPAPTLDIAFGVLHTALFVGAGLVGAAVAWRATQGPFLSLGVASGAVLFHQGLLQWRLLTASQLPTVWPPALLRAAVALSVAQALWVALAIVVGMRDSIPSMPGHADGLTTPAAEGGISTAAPPHPTATTQGARP